MAENTIWIPDRAACEVLRRSLAENPSFAMWRTVWAEQMHEPDVNSHEEFHSFDIERRH